MHVESSRLRWSPDGRILALRGMPRSVFPAGQTELHLLNPIDGKIVGTVAAPVPAAPGLIQEFDWVDRAQLAFAGSRGIGVIDVRTGVWRQVWAAGPGEGVLTLAVSPNRQHVAFTRMQAAGAAVMTVDLATGAVRELANMARPRSVVVQSWTADSAGILALVGSSEDRLPGTGNHVHLVPVDGGPMRALDLREFNLHDVQAHPDGRRLIFVAGGHLTELWAAAGLR
jgi:dipeptidyl aminopeptidase/acylaminoacyl peptidase